MGRKTAWCRWVAVWGAAAVLLQTGSCALTNSEVQRELVRQLVVPRLASLVSDSLFFLLDNALVRLTT
jgi:hypothetical protein